MPPAIKWLLIANVAVFFLQNITAAAFRFPLAAILGLNPYWVLRGMVWQLATYMFLHFNFTHIFFNMFALWMFGRDVERTWGARSFLFFYFFTGVGAGILSFLTSLGSNVTTIGASGAIFGILVAFGMMFPNRVVLVFFLFPMRARNFVILFGALELWMTLATGPQGGGVARFAHLGGMLFGYLYMKYGDKFRFSLPRVRFNLGSARRKKKEEDWMRFMKDDVDPILDKISREGIHSLTRKERRILKKARGRRKEG
jgi:membrane associated rhomboid family serine protease